ncbi:uncharacterized protein BO80DRAFT_157885 [Aspergillus ibericus CBS 121593]|uniref:Uncharacterized protein n=1 Tax=Aspergillus ibericus CBS 121593 TaxID=1448316 RepID=A0A395GU90_9EURO|nr:hypothetical protein BO80DRAFT_157885 [Aspergillus ibericus CBS 121593]RAK98528.1 hypothetical protein BO80DRAFT_157885 [Aspergillus ibericus CBS 121593]
MSFSEDLRSPRRECACKLDHRSMNPIGRVRVLKSFGAPLVHICQSNTTYKQITFSRLNSVPSCASGDTVSSFSNHTHRSSAMVCHWTHRDPPRTPAERSMLPAGFLQYYRALRQHINSFIDATLLQSSGQRYCSILTRPGSAELRYINLSVDIAANINASASLIDLYLKR